MQNFSNFILERVKLRARKDMPQIDKMDKFVEDVTANGYKISHKSIDPEKLKPTQTEFNKDKIKGMIETGNYKGKPIVITSDNYILDGHHRWKSYLIQKEQQPVIQVNMTFDELFDFVDGKKYIKYKQIHEMKLNDWYNSNFAVDDYMTDEEKTEYTKSKVDQIYKDYFTPEAFDRIYKSMKEDGEGGAVAMPANAPNGVAGVALPPVHNKADTIRRRKNGDIINTNLDADDDDGD